MQLIPLQKSAEYDDLESQFKAMFLSLYQKNINAQVDEVALYGMPHIGPISLIERHIAADGLAVLRTTTDDEIRQLFHAWKFNNPQRGTAFLRAYLNALFGAVFTIDQLWCKKSGTYPTDVYSEAELVAAAVDMTDYFLTSRLRVDIETSIVPERILKAARTAVAAKFVLELRIAVRIANPLNFGMIASGVQVVRTTGSSIFNTVPTHAPVNQGLAMVSGGSNLTYSNIDRIDMQTVQN